MKRSGAFLAILLFLGVTFASSQAVPGKRFELSTAFSFSSLKTSGGSDSQTYLIIPLRVGYYIWKGLEFEPELTLVDFEYGDTAFNLSGNFSYNLKTAGPWVPFVLAGAGFGNGFGVGPLVEGATSINATLLNFGAGLKYVLGRSAALRLDYRYTHNRLSKSGLIQNVNIHQVFIGAALFF
jgi:opacity protein-like surface antigen